MLKKINPGYVISDTGFSIKIENVECLTYQEGDNILNFSLGYIPEKRMVTISVSNVKFWQKPEGKLISDKEKKKILSNIESAVNLLEDNFELN